MFKIKCVNQSVSSWLWILLQYNGCILLKATGSLSLASNGYGVPYMLKATQSFRRSLGLFYVYDYVMVVFILENHLLIDCIHGWSHGHVYVMVVLVSWLCL